MVADNPRLPIPPRTGINSSEIENIQQHAFNAAAKIPEKRLRAIQTAIYPLLEKGVPWNEAKVALNQFINHLSQNRINKMNPLQTEKQSSTSKPNSLSDDAQLIKEFAIYTNNTLLLKELSNSQNSLHHLIEKLDPYLLGDFIKKRMSGIIVGCTNNGTA